MRVTLILIIANCLVQSLVGQTIENPLPPKHEGLNGVTWEEWHNQVPVSGEIRVGIMAGPNQTIDAKQGRFFVHVPDKIDGSTLCVSISSIDGRYSAQMEYEGAKLTIGENTLLWKSEHLAELNKISNERLVILAGVSDNCLDRAKNFVVASWTENIIDNPDIYFYVNSDSSPKLLLNNSDGSKEKIDFQEVQHDKKVTYKIRSKISRLQLEQTTQVFLSQKIRRGAGFSYKTYPFNVLL